METNNIVTFPNSASRGIHSRRPRQSKNGSPEERAVAYGSASVAQFAGPKRQVSQGIELMMRNERMAQRPKDRDAWYLGFAQRLREARVRLGISEEQAAAVASRSVTTWRKYETTGRGRCSFAVGKFAIHYGISLDELLSEDAPPVRSTPVPVLSETGSNERLRRDRKQVWRKVEAKLAYCQAWRELHHQIDRVLDLGLTNQVHCPAELQQMHDPEEPSILTLALLGFVMNAEREMLLTPAPTVAMLDWKRKRAGHQWYRLKDGSLEDEIQRAIDYDDAWLKAHPARQCHSNGSRRKND